MWLIYDMATGAELRRVAAADAGADEGAAPIPASALQPLPDCDWSGTARGFVDVPLIDGPRLLQILTMAEIGAITNDPDADVRGLVSLLLLLLAGGQPQRANSPLHQQGGMLLWAKGHLNEARRDQFLAGLAPTE